MILTGETKKAARRFSAIGADWETAAACVKMETEVIRPHPPADCDSYSRG